MAPAASSSRAAVKAKADAGRAPATSARSRGGAHAHGRGRDDVGGDREENRPGERTEGRQLPCSAGHASPEGYQDRPLGSGGQFCLDDGPDLVSEGLGCPGRLR